jgi:hypothetical protein
VTVAWPKPNRDLGFVDALALTGVAGLAVARFLPVARLPFWGCPFREKTGWPCPSCGLTRVADRVAHLNLAGAWDANPLGTVVALLFVGAIAISLVHLAFKVPVPALVPSRQEARAARIALVILVALNYAYIILKTRFPALL